jgi:hypothetical protein
VPIERTNHHACSFFDERRGGFHAFLALFYDVTQNAETKYSARCHVSECCVSTYSFKNVLVYTTISKRLQTLPIERRLASTWAANQQNNVQNVSLRNDRIYIVVSAWTFSSQRYVPCGC